MNNKMSSLCLVVMFCMGVLSVSAQQVTKEVALEKAMMFLQKSRRSNTNATKVPRKAPQLVLANNRDEFYIFNDEANGGYVIVSGDERMPEILGYSYNGRFDNDHIPCNMRAWLEGYAKQVVNMRTSPKNNVRRVYEYDSSWNSILPMIKCKWGQGDPHNRQCPEMEGEHTLVGCAAVAMAQIMFYHQWPKQTTNIIPGYTTETHGIAVSNIPITTIEWDKMILNYVPYMGAHEYTEEQAEAVATLMKLCGTAVEMDYGLNSSGAIMSECIDPFPKYFDYDGQIQDLVIDGFDMNDWNHIIYNELASGRPVMCAQLGHAFVIDGYDKDGFFHGNFGEVTAVDGYFLLSDQQVYEIIIGIQPEKPNNPHAYAVLDKGKMTFYYDSEKDNRSGVIFSNVLSCTSNNTEIEECVFDASIANLKWYNLEGFFENCNNLKSIRGIENLNTSEARTMRRMFNGCSSLKSLDLSGFNTKNVTDMLEMFRDCSSLASLDISNFDTKKVTNMMNMFCNCSSLNSLDVSGFNTENVETMGGLFYGCSTLNSLDVSKFKTDKVTDMRVMFQECSGLSSLDLSSFKTNNVEHMDYIFGRCFNLVTIYVSEGWNIEKVEEGNGMFYYCTNIVGGAGTVYDWNHYGGDYAHIDGGPANPGYLTYKENTAIQSVKADDNFDYVYSVSGVRMCPDSEDLNCLKKGLYILNGKKIIVK